MKLTDLFEAPISGKVTRVAGDTVELDGGAVKVDLKKFDVDTKDPRKTTLKPKKPTPAGQGNKIRPGQTVTIGEQTINEDDAEYTDPDGRFVVVRTDNGMYFSIGLNDYADELPITDRGFKSLDDAIDDAESMLEESLNEGVNDPGIFKAIFLAGGPGSGKGFVYNQTMKQHPLKVVNPDIAYEFLMRKAGMEFTPDEIASEKGQELRFRAKELQAKQEELYKAGRLGLVIDGTAKDADKIAKIKTRLDALGYDTMMVFVNTDLETNLDQNKKRERTLPDAFVEKMWSAVQKNIGRLQSMFGKENFVIIDNSYDQRPYVQDHIDRVQKAVNAFMSAPPSKPLATQWIESQKK
jgi:predicted kinase